MSRLDPSPAADLPAPILRLDGLSVRLPRNAEREHAILDVSLALAPNEILCVVGESGSGKSMTSSAIMRLLPPGVVADHGSIVFDGRDLLKLSEAQMREVRGAQIAMVFQEPMTALNPLHTVGQQIGEMFRIHTAFGVDVIEQRVHALLDEVRMPDPQAAAGAYPHELSGGQRQRAMIAMALALEPRVLIADEPTTALDVSVQAQILQLLFDIVREDKIAVLLITHNLGVVARLCTHVAVMYAGRIIERGTMADVFNQPSHPYTKALLAAVPTQKTRKGTLQGLGGSVPDPYLPHAGCRFAPRCAWAEARCGEAVPPDADLGNGHRVACIKAGGTA